MGAWGFFPPHIGPLVADGHYSEPQYLQDLFKVQFYLIAFLYLYVPHTVC